jgi:hypothetical protein
MKILLTESSTLESLSQVEQSQAREIICDKWMSCFSYENVAKVFDLLIQKTRKDGIIIITDNDANLLSRQIFREQQDLKIVNEKMFDKLLDCGMRSLLTLDVIENMVPAGFVVTHKGYDSHTFTIKIRRIS